MRGRAHAVLARTEQEGLAAAAAMGLDTVSYPMTIADVHAARANGYNHLVLVRVDGWEQGPQPVHVAHAIAVHADADLELPTTDGLRYGAERAQLAADRLARLREAKRTGSPFLEAAGIPQTVEHVNTWAQRLHHWLHLCPTRRAGLPCTVPPGTCRWPS